MISRVSGKAYFVYILWSPLGQRFYIGITEDLEQRLRQHNSDATCGWTARYRPWTLVYSEMCSDYTAARRRENELKRQKSGKGLFAKTGLNAASFRHGS